MNKIFKNTGLGLIALAASLSLISCGNTKDINNDNYSNENVAEITNEKISNALKQDKIIKTQDNKKFSYKDFILSPEGFNKKIELSGNYVISVSQYDSNISYFTETGMLMGSDSNFSFISFKNKSMYFFSGDDVSVEEIPDEFFDNLLDGELTPLNLLEFVVFSSLSYGDETLVNFKDLIDDPSLKVEESIHGNYKEYNFNIKYEFKDIQGNVESTHYQSINYKVHNNGKFVIDFYLEGKNKFTIKNEENRTVKEKFDEINKKISEDIF